MNFSTFEILFVPSVLRRLITFNLKREIFSVNFILYNAKDSIHVVFYILNFLSLSKSEVKKIRLIFGLIVANILHKCSRSSSIDSYRWSD